MEESQIKLDDLHRIFIGEAPLEFLVEVLGRAIILYIALLIILRLMGKRMCGQLTISELAVMITLGAIVSSPMQIPERGIVQGIVILICALAFQRGINYMGVKSKKFEKTIQGDVCLLVSDGVINNAQLEKEKISKPQLFAMLRNENIFNLGNVERVYLEANGNISIFTSSTGEPGLSIVPAADDLEPEHQPTT